MDSTTNKKFLAVAFFFLVGLINVNAQTLQKSAQKIRSYKNISYTDIVQTKFHFQEDFSVDTLKSQLFPLPKEAAGAGYYLIKSNTNSYAFDGTKMVNLYLPDSTYRIQTESVNGQNTRTLLHWSQTMNKLSQLPLKKIKQLQDTTINNTTYTNIKVTEFDSVINNEHHYTITNFILDKNSFLPIHIIRRMKGISGEGMLFELIETHTYSAYEFNKKSFPDLSLATIPANFRVPPRSIPVVFLPNGTPAPTLKAFDLSRQALDLEQFKGKVVLLNFTLIGCPHCAAAVPMLNRLHEKYKEEGLVIINIYPLDQKEAIIKFDHKQNIKTPSYTSDKNIQEVYPYDGYPTFYLLDKNGLVAQSYSGYYKALESALTEKIDSINK